MKVIGDKILLKKTERINERKFGDIVVPISADAGFNVTKATIIGMGDEAREKTGFKEGDNIIFDHYSHYYDTFPNVIVDSMNVICRFDDDKNMIPPKDQVLSKEMKADSKIKGIIIPNMLEGSLYKTYKILKLGMGTENSDLAEGDEIFVDSQEKDTKVNHEGDIFLFIKIENILGKIVNE